MREELLLQARLIEKSLNLEGFPKFSGSEDDLDLLAYKQLKEKFISVRSSYSKCRFIYLLGRHPDGKIFFFLDSEPADSKDYSPPGQIFNEVSNNIRNIFFTANDLVAGPQADRWGAWVSAFTPVLNPQTGKVIAIFGMDIDARTWGWLIFTHSFLTLSFFLSIYLLMVIFLYLQHKTKLENLRLVAAQSALLVSENKYRGLFLNFYDAMMLLEPNSMKFISGNPAMLKIFVIKDEKQLLSLGPGDLSPERQPDGSISIEEAQRKVEMGLRQGYLFFEWRHKRLTGEEFPATVWMSRLDLSGETLIQAIVRDITNQKNIEEENSKYMKELEVFYKISMGREERIIELKKEVDKLKLGLGK